MNTCLTVHLLRDRIHLACKTSLNKTFLGGSVKSSWRLLMVGLAAAALVLASGGAIQMISTNTLNCHTLGLGCAQSTNNRWEPSSSVGTTWVTTWTDFIGRSSWSSSWDASSSSWSTPVLHGTNYGDLYLAYNRYSPPPVHYLVMLDAALNLLFRSSTDATGSNWNPPITVTSSADYPSVAVSSNGTIVIGFCTFNGTIDNGYQTMVSMDGGQTWTGGYTVTSSQYQIWGRVVWPPQSNAFHVLFVDSTNSPTLSLKRAESSDGTSWTIASTPLDTYTAPAVESPGPIVNNTDIYYSPNLDAAAESGLGWVVVYPAARTDDPTINNVKYCAETLGCTTISYSNDLFLQGITTSGSGDLWMNLFTYSDPSLRTVPLKQIGIYRTTGGSSLSGFVNPAAGIDPTSWVQMAPPASSGRCVADFAHDCYAMGDYARPAMNALSGASLPFVSSSTRTSDLFQTFVQDPATGAPPVPGLGIGSAVTFGLDSTYKGLLTAGFATQRQPNASPSFPGYTQQPKQP